MMESFHFITPEWLLALIPLAMFLWWVSFGNTDAKAWEKIIDPKLLPLLLQGEDSHKETLIKSLLGVSWFIAVIALANPVWEKIPRPVFQTNNARVIVLDLSNSMLADDLKPSRLARARFKVEDILSNEEEGQIGLVVFAGDAFTASPLTRDADTIRSLLQVLKPQIMPSQGSRVDLGLEKAYELLKQAGVNQGQVLLIADGVSDDEKALKVSKDLQANGYMVSVLGVGTEKGGELKFRKGKAVKVTLEEDTLRKIAYHGGGRYHQISGNGSDLKTVITQLDTGDIKEQIQNDDLKSNDWKATGPYLVLLLLPLAAFAFRKGWLLNILITFGLIGMFQPQPVYAYSFTESWNDLWKTGEQQADIALKNKQYDLASKLSSNPLRRGSADYKKGDYKKALENFSQIKEADGQYNKGNALAKLGKYKDAIAAYEKALKADPDMEDAKINKKAIEDFLKKQKKQEQEQSNKHKKDKNNKNEKGESSDQNDQKNKDQKQDSQSSDKNNNDGKKGDKKKQKEKTGQKSKDENQFKKANNAQDEKEKEKKKNGEKQEDKTSQPKDEKAEGNKAKPNKQQQDQQEKLDKTELEGIKSEAEKLNDEEKMAAKQWLRRIPDDPGGLLRRKFLSQYRQRRQPNNTNENPW